MTEAELNAMGYSKRYDYTQYAHDNHVNVIPEDAFKHLVRDTFKTIADNLRETYGPYGSTILVSSCNETTATKDGYNIFCSLGFNHQYKRMVYLAIKKIIERVNTNVGDGTTSCILLAEKIFNKLNEIVKTPEDKRTIKTILDDIESYIQIPNEVDATYIKPLTESNLYNLLMVAANYDSELVDYIIDALCPVCEDETNPDSKVVSIDNVIVNTGTPHEVSSTTYKVEHLPGKYRVRVNMDTDFALAFSAKRKVKILLYDHQFGTTEWHNFIEKYDKSSYVFLMARSFSKVFMDNDYVRYAKNMALVKEDLKVVLCELKGGFYQDEVNDLAAVLKTKPLSVDNVDIDFENAPEVDISIHNYNCMCFYDVEPPTSYIENLIVKSESEESYAKKTLINDRITALKMDINDALITVKAESTIEMKMLGDKIDDCISIAKSAFNYGISPNLLWFGYRKLALFEPVNSDLRDKTFEVVNHIIGSIVDIAVDIYRSKHSNDSQDVVDAWKAELTDGFYESGNGDQSYDILTDNLVDMTQFPTSAQYDAEIIIASISIVKYLLSSRALIFDANILTPQGDEGHFERLD